MIQVLDPQLRALAEVQKYDFVVLDDSAPPSGADSRLVYFECGSNVTNNLLRWDAVLHRLRRQRAADWPLAIERRARLHVVRVVSVGNWTCWLCRSCSYVTKHLVHS